MIQARLYDGTVLRFPEGTDEEIINQTVQNYMASQGAVPQVEPVEEEETELTETLFESVKAIPRGFANSFLSAGEGIGELANIATDAVGLTDLIDEGDENELVRLSREGRSAVDEYLGAKEAYKDEWAVKFGEGLGSFASFFTPAGVARLAGLTGNAAKAAKWVPAGALAVGAGASDQVQRIENLRSQGINVSDEDYDLSVGLGGGVGLSELLPLQRLFKVLDKDLIPATFKEYVTSALKQGSFEAIQETAASFAQDLIERDIVAYNPNLPEGQSYWDELTVGGAVGATADLLLNGFRGNRRFQTTQAQRDYEQKLRDLEEESAEIARTTPSEMLAGLGAAPGIDPADPLDVAIQSAEIELQRAKDVDTSLIENPNQAELEATQDEGRLSQIMRNYARLISNTTKGAFPVNTTFAVASGPTVPVMGTVKNEAGEDVPQVIDYAPSFVVKDSQTGQQYGTPQSSIENASRLAYSLNTQIINSSLSGSLNTIIETADEQYSPEDKQRLRRVGFRLLHPDGQTYTSAAVNQAAGTTNVDIDKTGEAAYNESLTAEEMMQKNGDPNYTDNLTAAQQINRIRLQKGLKETDTFSVQEILPVLGENFGNLGSDNIAGATDTETYTASLDQLGKPAVVSSSGEVIYVRRPTAVEAVTNPKVGNWVDLQSIEEAQIEADKLNQTESVPKQLFDKPVTVDQIKELLAAKNVSSDINSPEVSRIALLATGKSDIGLMNGAERSILYQKIRSMPKFSVPVKLPLFDTPAYTREQFVAAARRIQQTGDNSLASISEATGILTSETGGLKKLQRLQNDLNKQGLTKEGLAEQKETEQAEVLLLPSPNNSLDELRQKLNTALQEKGFDDARILIEKELRDIVGFDEAGNPIYGRELTEEVDPETGQSYTTEGYYQPIFKTVVLSLDNAQVRDENGQPVPRENVTPEQRKSAVAQVLNHELIHAVRNLDLLTAKEYSILEKLASQRTNKTTGETFLNTARRQYSDQNTEVQMEEAVAEMFRQSLADQSVLTGKPKAVSNKVFGFFERFNNALAGSGFQNFDDIVRKVNQGTVGRRKRNEIRTLRATKEAEAEAIRRGEEPVEAPPAPPAIGEGTVLDDDEQVVEPDVSQVSVTKTGQAVPDWIDSRESRVLGGLTPEAIEKANASSRASGAVSEKAVIPKAVAEVASVNDKILDFGAGKAAVQTKGLRDKGYDVTAYDFGQNSQEGIHDPKALDRKYNVVYASNVLNVQDNQKMLNTTLNQISNAMRRDGSGVFNFASSPRYGAFEGMSPKKADEYLFGQLQKKFENVQKADKGFKSKIGSPNYSAPIYIVSQPIRSAAQGYKRPVLKSKAEQTERIVNGRKQFFRVTDKGGKTSFTRGNKEYPVGKVVGDQVFFHKNYIPEMPPLVQELYQEGLASLPEGYEFNTLMYKKPKGDAPAKIRFDQSADFDTAREPTPGRQITYSQDGIVGDREENQIFHHKWQWVGEDYTGFNVDDSYEWSRQWVPQIKNFSTIGRVENWHDQLTEAGLPIDGDQIQYPTAGINVRSDGDINYADLIVSGDKKLETRKSDSLRPYVGSRVGIVQTGVGSPKLLGYADIGEPTVVDGKEFDALRDQHLVPKGSDFDIVQGGTKHVYPLTNAEKLPSPVDIPYKFEFPKEIVARRIPQIKRSRVYNGTVSNLFPTAKARKVDPAKEIVLSSFEDYMENAPDPFNKNMDMIRRTYNNYRPSADLRTNRKRADAFIEHLKNNLVWLHDQYPEKYRKRAKKWYVGANKVASEFADRYALTMPQTAGVIAALSPQKDWHMNASLAERVLDITFERGNMPYTKAMDKTAKRIFAKKEYQAGLKKIRGKTLGQLTGLPDSDLLKAMWIRTYDETYNGRSYRVVSPEGDFLGFSKKKDGKDASVAWGSLTEIGKAVHMLRGAEMNAPLYSDVPEISAALGQMNKVRNFYNNILNPRSKLGFVTIDTHAVAAALLKPLSGGDREVLHNFAGGKGSGSSSITGYRGTYPFYEEAYKRAAAERNLLPREMQSIVWEAVRGRFTPGFKTNKSNVKMFEDLWDQYRNKKLDTEEIWEKVDALAPRTIPDWDRPSDGIPEGKSDTSYKKFIPERSVPRQRYSRVDGRGSTDIAGNPTRRIDEIPQAKLEETVERNTKYANEATAGAIPKISFTASPEAQYIAENPEEARKLPPNLKKRYSRVNTVDLSPEAQRVTDRIIDISAPPDQTPGESYIDILESPFRGKFEDMMIRFKVKALNQYEGVQWLSTEASKRYKDVPKNERGELMADAGSIQACLFTDRARGLLASTITDGVIVYQNGLTKVVPFFHKGKQISGLIGVNEMLFNNQYEKSLETLAQSYAITRRGERINSQGKLSPVRDGDREIIDAEVKKYVNEEGKPIIEEWYDMWQAYNAYTVRYLKDTGLLSEEEALKWQKYSDYFPFYKQENIEKVDLKQPVGRSGEPIDVKMLDAITRNLSTAIELGMRNVARQRVVRDAVTLGIARDADTAPDADISKTIMNFRANGENKRYIIDDQLLFDSIVSMSQNSLPAWVNVIFGKPAEFLRNMVTREPGFMIANMLRDTLAAHVTSGAKTIPVWDTVWNFRRGMDTLSKYGVVGGYDFRDDPDDVVKYIAGEARRRGIYMGDLSGAGEVMEMPLLKVFKRAWQITGQASTMSDAATRTAVYNDVLARTGNEAEAAFQALEVLNFSRRGNNGPLRAVFAAVPFLNARMQGLDVLWRTARGKHSADQGLTRGQVQHRAALRLAQLMALTALYYTMVSDEEEYKELTLQERDDYFTIPLKSVGIDEPLRIPIAFEIGILTKVIPERILDYIYGSTTERDIKESFKRQAMVTTELDIFSNNAAFGPLYEVSINKNGYTNRNIVPIYMDNDIIPRMQRKAGTSETAILLTELIPDFISESLDISPLKVEHIINGYTGSLGRYAIQLLDSVSNQLGDFPDAPARRWTQFPVIQRFFGTTVGYGPREQLFKLKEEVDELTGTLRFLRQNGRLDEYRALLQARRNIYGIKGTVEGLYDRVNSLRKQKEYIQRSDFYDAETKRERMDDIDRMTNEILSIIPQIKEKADLPAFSSSSE
jgi:hypothetical protein